MSSTVVQLTTRKQDVNGDPDWNTTLYNLDAITQIIGTTIKLFQGEWWENTNLGTPLFQKILGVYGATAAAVSTLLQARILSLSTWVTGLSNVTCTYTASTKTFAFKADASTIYGTTTVSFPDNGSSATIGQE
jgi:hypothetical protein